MYHPFSVAETIKTSWDILKKNFVTIVVFSTIAVFIIVLITAANQMVNNGQDFMTSVLLFFAFMLIQSYTTLGLNKVIFTLIDSEYYEFGFSQMVPTFRMVLSFISISLLFSFIVTTYVFIMDATLGKYDALQELAQIFGSIVVLYFALRCMFCVCFIVDDDSGPFESLRQSFELTKNSILKIILIMLINLVLIATPVLAAIYFKVGILAVIGLILTYPFVNIILIVTYRKLIYSHKDVDDYIAETM